MLIQTHWIIGKAVSKTLDSKIAWDYPAFQYGCVVPDLLHRYPDHTFGESQNFITSLVKKLQRAGMDIKQSGEDRRFFVRLGIVCHYIADCFCQAHNDPGYDGLIAHLYYETRLQEEFNRCDLMPECRTGIVSMAALARPGYFPDFFQQQHKAYLAEKVKMNKDLHYALQTATAAAASILSRES